VQGVLGNLLEQMGHIQTVVIPFLVQSLLQVAVKAEILLQQDYQVKLEGQVEAVHTHPHLLLAQELLDKATLVVMDLVAVRILLVVVVALAL
jgi:hypothetical protein